MLTPSLSSRLGLLCLQFNFLCCECGHRVVIIHDLGSASLPLSEVVFGSSYLSFLCSTELFLLLHCYLVRVSHPSSEVFHCLGAHRAQPGMTTTTTAVQAGYC